MPGRISSEAERPRATCITLFEPRKNLKPIRNQTISLNYKIKDWKKQILLIYSWLQQKQRNRPSIVPKLVSKLLEFDVSHVLKRENIDRCMFFDSLSDSIYNNLLVLPSFLLCLRQSNCSSNNDNKDSKSLFKRGSSTKNTELPSSVTNEDAISFKTIEPWKSEGRERVPDLVCLALI